jgi:hypothetical protein
VLNEGQNDFILKLNLAASKFTAVTCGYIRNDLPSKLDAFDIMSKMIKQNCNAADLNIQRHLARSCGETAAENGE